MSWSGVAKAMKWNVFFLLFSLGMIVYVFLQAEAITLAQAESVSKEVSKRVEVDEEDLREQLTPVLSNSNERFAVISCFPITIMARF